MKGIILAGGSGTRLYPLTTSVSKQILPVYDKPMIYYPLSVLMLAGIREVLIISTERDIDLFKNLFGDGSQLGLSFDYIVQDAPNGIAEAFILGESFIDGDSVALILGDNVFYGQSFGQMLQKAQEKEKGGTIFGYYVKHPEAYGIIEFDEADKPTRIVEKPKVPTSRYAVPGLYFYDKDVVEIAKNLEPSARGELEITDINNVYLNRGDLDVIKMGRGMAWLDTGTHANLLEASNYVMTIQNRQGLYIACIEEIAYKKGFINKEQLEVLIEPLKKTAYGEYLMDVMNGL